MKLVLKDIKGRSSAKTADCMIAKNKGQWIKTRWFERASLGRAPALSTNEMTEAIGLSRTADAELLLE